jgi:hypothetical protein
MKPSNAWVLFVGTLAFSQQADIAGGLPVRGQMPDSRQIPFANFYEACSAARQAGLLLTVTQWWNTTASGSCHADLSFAGGMLRQVSCALLRERP